MEVIFFLVPVGIVTLLLAIALFRWAVKNDQFEDLEREGRRILFDDDLPAAKAPAASTKLGTPDASAESKSGTAVETPAIPTATPPATDAQNHGKPT
ncbi:hypothetical protein HDN1F_11920 [gamma proteobacterium HdN1]|nr:hypothetical protein HDN1F_11920 [gamma proteobacterium HdN1]